MQSTLQTPHPVRSVDLGISLLEANDRHAAANRRHFREAGLIALNLVSSPGAGKTALLERTLREFGKGVPCAAVVGDLATDNDAQRLGRWCRRVAQITTGNRCHLEAQMVSRALASVSLAMVRMLFIENVGNLVCPASFDLGEKFRVVLLSVPEGEDKPLKYPPIFKSADAVLLTKIDTASALGFDRATALMNIRLMAPRAKVMEISSRSGEGMGTWYAWLRSILPEV